MSWLRKLKYLLPSHRRALERDMKEEFESVAAMAERRELGNLTLAAEGARAVWGWDTLGDIGRDLQYAARTMRHSPGFTATAVLSLALGIGANTAIFSLIDALMLRWLPVHNPQELVQVERWIGGSVDSGGSYTYPMVQALDQQRDIFSGVAGFSSAGLFVGPPGAKRRVWGAWVTANYYETLGLKPLIGRLLTKSDDKLDAPLAAVLSYSYWQRWHGGDAGIVGETELVNGLPVTIVGVSPQGFNGSNVGIPADITVTVSTMPRLAPTDAALLGPGNFWLRVLARPRGGLAISQVKARLNTRWPALAEQLIPQTWPKRRREQMVKATYELPAGGTGYTYLRTTFGKPLWVLMGVVALILLIACANVANLLLARAATRQRELSVRLAIGAGRARLVRQLLTESLLLATLGALGGVGLAWVTARFLFRPLSSTVSSFWSPQPAFDLAPNWHILAFASAIALGTAILFGLAPALRATARGDVGKGASTTRTTQVNGIGLLVSVQVALSLLLLVGAGLFVRTLQNLVHMDLGYQREGILLVDAIGIGEGYRGERLAQFFHEAMDRVRNIPGVKSVGISGNTPLSGNTWTEAVVPKGQPLPERDTAMFLAAGPGYFATLRTPVLLGREFNEADERGPLVAIVDETFAERYFPGRNAVGEIITSGVSQPPSDFQIVGVVRNTVTRGMRMKPYPMVYLSFFQKRPEDGTLKFMVNRGTIEIRTSEMGPVASAAVRELQPMTPSTPVGFSSLEDQIDFTLVQEHLMARLAGGFGGLGLLLACVGLYGLLSYGVARRTKEIGVRLALGAQPTAVQWMVMRGALRPVIVGMMVGLPATWLASRWIQAMLFGLAPTDPTILAGAIATMAGSGLVVAHFPARRAARVDPMVALRHE